MFGTKVDSVAAMELKRSARFVVIDPKSYHAAPPLEQRGVKLMSVVTEESVSSIGRQVPQSLVYMVSLLLLFASRSNVTSLEV